MPDGLSMMTTWASSNAMRNPAGTSNGFGAVMFMAMRCPARSRCAGSSTRASSTITLPVAHRRRTSAQLLSGSRRRNAAATVPPTSSPPIMKVVSRSATNEIEDPLQRRVQVLGLRAAPLRHVGAPAALAANGSRHRAHDLARVEAAGEVGRYGRDERDLVAFHA